MDERRFSVYMHTTPSGKVYIGITGCSLIKRWNNGRGYCQNVYFSRAIKKYGWENIKHETLISGLTKDEAKLREIEFIKEFNSTDKQHGYNLTYGGDLELRNDESKARMSDIKKRQMENPDIKERVVASQSYRDKTYCTKDSYRKTRSDCMKANWANPVIRAKMLDRAPSKRKNTKRVLCVETGVVYESIAEAARSIKGNASNIITCCVKKNWTVNGYHWRSADDNDITIPEHSQYAPWCKAVRCIETGVSYGSIREASKAVGGSETAIGNCARGKLQTSHGLRWEYVKAIQP